MNAKAVIMTAFDLAPALARWSPVDCQCLSHCQQFCYKRFLMAEPFCLSPPYLHFEWADRTQRMIIPLVLIRLFNYRVEALFTETYAELTVEQRR